MRIWDIHCHLPTPHVPGRDFAHQVAAVLSIAQRVGIDRLGLFLRTGIQQANHPSDEEIERVLVQYRGKVFGFVWVTPVEDTGRALQQLNRWVADGPMVGMKLAGDSGHCHLPEYDPLFRRTVELQAVIYVHSWIKVGGNPPYPGGGNLPTEPYPWEVAELAARYGDYPFICGHTGGDFELGIAAIRDQQNVLCEIAGSYPRAGMVEMAVRELGAQRVVYGSDIPGRSFSTQLAKVLGAEITALQKQAILNDNLQRLMEPICRRKGIAL